MASIRTVAPRARLSRVLTLGLGLLVLAPRAAWSEATDRERVSALLEEGAALYEKEQYAPALQKFQEAYAIVPSSRILYNIAKVMDALHNNPDAANAYAGFLRGARAGNKGDSDTRLESARQRLAELGISVGLVDVEAQPATATLQIDRAPVTYVEVYLAPGAHEVRAEAPGFQPATQILAVAAGQRTVVKLKLAPALDALATVHSDAAASDSGGGVRGAAKVVFIIAGALGVGALAMTGATAATYGQLPHAPAPAPKTFRGSYASELTLARVTDGLWVGAGLVGAVGGGMWLFGGPAPGGGGEVGLGGRW